MIMKPFDIKIFTNKIYEEIEIYTNTRCFTIKPKDVINATVSKLGILHIKEKSGDSFFDGKDIIALLTSKKIKETIYEDKEMNDNGE